MTAAMGATRIMELRSSDIPEVAQLLSAQQGAALSLDEMSERLRWLAANPSFTADIPFAWGVRTNADRLVGVMLAVPQRFQLRGETMVALMSSGFYVAPEFRGAGYLLFQAYRRYRSRYVLYATSANQISARLWSAVKASTIPGSDREWLLPIHWAPLAEEALHPRLGAVARAFATPLRLLDLKGTSAGSGTLAPVTSATDLSDLIADNPDGLVRDEAYLRWRYFEEPNRTTHLFRFRDTGVNAAIAVNLSRRGHRQQVRTLTQMDSWGTMPHEAWPAALNGLSSLFRSRADVIALRCATPEAARANKAAGYRERVLGNFMGWFIDEKQRLTQDPMLLASAASDAF